jgi:hypothetical protein
VFALLLFRKLISINFLLRSYARNICNLKEEKEKSKRGEVGGKQERIRTTIYTRLAPHELVKGEDATINHMPLSPLC